MRTHTYIHTCERAYKKRDTDIDIDIDIDTNRERERDRERARERKKKREKLEVCGGLIRLKRESVGGAVIS